MKLSKIELNLHNQALDILSKDVLTDADKWFVLEHYQEGGNTLNKLNGAFFTPYDLARDLVTIEMMFDSTVVDLCAGIGMLSFALMHMNKWEEIKPKITCVEINPEFVEVGKKLVPEATWICGNILDDELLSSLGHFKQSISNPPFGNVKTIDRRTNYNYTGSDFEYKAIEQASKISDYGTFIVPQMSAPYRYSVGDGKGYKRKQERKCKAFLDQTGLKWEDPKGVSTLSYQDLWKTKVPVCEIVSFDFKGDMF